MGYNQSDRHYEVVDMETRDEWICNDRPVNVEGVTNMTPEQAETEFERLFR